MPDLLIDEHQAALSVVTFCSWCPVIAMKCVDRFVDPAKAYGEN